MTIENLIKKYEEELLICDDSFKHNKKYDSLILAHDQKMRKKAIHGFIIDLKKLLV